MNTPHLHLLLNHVPTIGTIIAVATLVMSLVRKNDGMRRFSFELFCVVALLTLPAYLSGVGTQIALQDLRPEIPVVLMNAHHDAAVWASLLMLLTGGVAWIALWQTRRLSHPSRIIVAAVLILSTLTVAAMARTATMGGEIQHSEILEDPDGSLGDALTAAEAEPAFLSAVGVAAFVTGKTWVWPASEALHFIGLWLLFGVLLLANLRLLGAVKAIPFATIHRLLPWAALGLGVNAITGMMFVIAAPTQYLENVAFFWKIGFLLVAGAQLIYLTAFDGPWGIRAEQNAPVLQKALAAVAILSWLGVMYFGRMLPFIGNAF